MKFGKKILVIGAAALAVALVAAIWVSAQGDEIHACVNPSGITRILQAGEECTPQEWPLSWNQEGPPGPQGPQGLPGVLGFYVVEGEHVGCEPGIACPLRAYCNAGDMVTGGAVRKATIYYYDDEGVGLIGMEPYYDPDEELWAYIAYVNNRFTFVEDFWAIAICADMP